MSQVIRNLVGIIKLAFKKLATVKTFDDVKRIFKFIVAVTSMAIWYKYYRARPHDSIPMLPEMTPLLGHTLHGRHWGNMTKHVYGLVKKADFPKAIAGTAYIPYYIVLLLDPELVKFVFDKQFNKFEKGEKISTEMHELLGDGIFTSDPPDWKFHRKVASRMFSMRNLKDYMFDCTINHTKKVITKIEAQGNDMNNINIYDMLGRFTLDAFTDIAFGTTCDSLSSYPSKHPFAEAFDTLIEAMAKRHLIPPSIWKFEKIFNIGNERIIHKNIQIINEFAGQVLDSRQTSLAGITDESGHSYNDIISLFIKHEKKIKNTKNNNEKLTRQELKDIAMNMIIAGRDTTRLLMSWFLYEMCNRPEIKQKIYDEMDEYVQTNNTNEMTYESILNSLYYLESTLLESLRMNPVVPWLVRIAKEDVQLPNGWWIRENNEVMVPTYIYGRNPKIYQDPLKFDPHRFYDKCMEDNIAPINVFDVYKFPFFNINPRLCLGRKLALMEAKVFLFYFFQTYDFKMTDPNQKIEIKTGIVLNMKEGLRLNITKRQKVN